MDINYSINELQLFKRSGPMTQTPKKPSSRSTRNNPSKTINTRKRIYNPATKRYYSVRQRTSKSGRKGQIKGFWKPPSKS